MPPKVPKQQSQEFFPRSANNTKTKGFIFNQAPINKREAQEELKENIMSGGTENKSGKKNKRSSFMAKLYDDDEALEDEMKVFDMDRAESGDDQPEEGKINKRAQKATDKKGSKPTGARGKSSEVSTNKINRLKFNPGSLGLFAIAEIHKKYLIVNYTRNTKGYISLEGREDLSKRLEVGQFILAQVISSGTSKYMTESSGHRNKKLQLTISSDLINKSLTAENIANNMVLQGEVESKEAKGYLINFGLKDKTKGFLPFNDASAHLQIGSLVQVIIKKVMSSSKITKCELISQTREQPDHTNYMNEKEITLHNLKPGYLVNGKISRLLENGIEVGFLTGFKGTIFTDHLDKCDPSKYKVGEKLSVRIIMVDPQSQNISLSILPHILKLENVANSLALEGVKVGQVVEKSTVDRELFGGSFRVKVGKEQYGFLHKIHTKKEEQVEEEVEESEPEDKKKKKEKVKAAKDLEVGQKLEKLRVKEINYFDGVPILSLREDIINSSSLNYDNIKCGDFVSGIIQDADEKQRFITLTLNDFVKGRLYIEHMADYPLKVIPPKYLDYGKPLKVRVFNVDPATRTLEFTRKETLLKAKVDVYQSYKEVQKGAKLYGVIVGENEHGYIVKSFGGVKGLLTFTDIKTNSKSSKKDTSQFKFGSLIKAYVLFKKKDQGMALTLDKVKAKELREENKSKGKSTSNSEVDGKAGLQKFEDYLPKEDELAQLKEKYKTLLKVSQEKSNVGKVNQFRVLETTDRYFVCKSLDCAKKSQNYIAILPNILINKHFQPSFTLEDFTFNAINLEASSDSFPVISTQFELMSLKDSIPKSNADISIDSQNRIYTGVVSESNKSGVFVRFLDGLKKLILVKDLETVQNFPSIYTPGKVIRTALNKLGRLCLKNNVVYLNDQEQIKKDQQVKVKSFYSEIEAQLKAHQVKIGDKVQGEVSLVKDYGLIVSVEKYEGLTGFVLTEHQVTGKQYKDGQKITCIVMDIDFEKEIIDLSERLVESDKAAAKNQTKINQNSAQSAIVELNKEDYLIVSFKQNKKKFGLLNCQSFNNDVQPNPNDKYQIGDDIEVSVSEETESGFYLVTPINKVASKSDKNGAKAGQPLVALQQGVAVSCQIKSKKHDCMFLQIQQQNNLVIGRMHRIECQSDAEFKNFSVGEIVQAKVLKVSQDDKKTWIELTRRKEHMKKTSGLDQETLDKTYQSMDDLKNGQQYDALITDVNYSYSSPISISLSPFLRGHINFDKIITPDTLQKEGSSYLQIFNPGNKCKITYNNGLYSIIQSQSQTAKLTKGMKLVVRFVKAVNGKGITVQINDKTFGFIDISEITDDILGRVCESQLQNSPLFVARIIGFDKHEKPILSSRESIVDDAKWALIGPEGKTVHFQKFDEKNQKLGNQRNKLLKFTKNVALQEGDLCLGYVCNIGKSGCFIQIGYNTTVRAGLNELSDDSSYDFKEQMPLGRLVLGRVVKVDSQNAEKRFNVTLRKSMVVYGTNTIDKSGLQPESVIECIVMAIADGKLFAQVKGSYHKLKIKGQGKTAIKVGDHVMAKLEHVSKEKITAEFVEKVKGSGMTEDEKQIEKLWRLVEDEAQKDIEAQKEQAQQAENDVQLIKNLGNPQAELDEQIKDLNELKDDDEDMEVVQGDDSDEEEMQRIIKESKVYEDDKESQDDEDMEEDDDEEDEDDDDEKMDIDDDSSDEDDQHKKKKSGKQSLKQRVKEEQGIRKQEQALKEGKNQPKSIDDFERLLIQNQDQSYVWIQYMAFMIDRLGIESARKVAERAVKSVSISNEEDKFNIWVAYMNLENNFGTQEPLEKCIKRALEVNERKRIYLQLINIYQTSQKFNYIEDIYKQLVKKFNTSFKIYSAYIDFLFTMRDLKKDKSNFLVRELTFSEPKQVLQRALQSLPKDKHVNIICKFGQLEFKHGQPESGRTMLEGIVSNYPKRMDIWSIYMDMESKYSGDNKQQARHLFERCLTNEFIMKKPKKMKLVFQKYMEFEMHNGNKKNVDKLRERVEQYLEKAFNKDEGSSDSE